MLSQIGCITLPPATLDKLYQGEVLDESEQEMVKRTPTVAEKFCDDARKLTGKNSDAGACRAEVTRSHDSPNSRRCNAAGVNRITLVTHSSPDLSSIR